MLRMITLRELLISTWPCSWPPQTPTMVLFDPIRIKPVIEPWTQITAALVPPAAALSWASVATMVGVARQPPVVVVTLEPDTAAQPTSGLAAGGVQPPAPPVPG